ncbi:MAG: chlorophyll synthase ChlG [Pikeienuella sp.]
MSVNQTTTARNKPHPGPGPAPDPAAVLELLKPVTWFPPMWAFGCGVISAGTGLAERWPLAILGIVLAGPLVCAMSQAANDWYDRHVDAINEPQRPIPSGRIPGTWGFRIALFWTAVSLAVATLLGPWGFAAALVAIIAAWAYSAPPIRLKSNGWLSCLVCGLSYETLPWITGAVVMTQSAPAWEVVVIATLYGLGAHGIMVLNDFKAIEGDRRLGLRSLPVILGPARAARLACWVMFLPQLLVVALLAVWAAPISAAIVALLLALQLLAMRRLLQDPEGRAPWYNATGVLLYVLGMLVSAIALGGLVTGDTP